MSVNEIVSNYFIAMAAAEAAFSSDMRKHVAGPSKRFLKAQKRLDELKEELQKMRIRPFTKWAM